MLPQQLEQLGTLLGRDGTVWTTVNNPVGRLPAHNLLRGAGGPTAFIISRVETEEDVFLELFDRKNLEDIVKFTVAEAKRQKDETFHFDVETLKAFLGLCIARGVYKARNEPAASFWSDRDGRPIFSATMPRDKYLTILRYIRFDCRDSRQSRRGDKFHLIRCVWDRVIENSRKCYHPRELNTVDEQLFPCRSRCCFIQYMPQKPGKFGIKFWLLCDALNYYVCNASPYVGKYEERTNAGLASDVVLGLCQPFYGSGIHVTTDNFFTSLSLSKLLAQKQISLVGTVRQNRREIPPQFGEKQQKMELYSSTALYTDAAMLTAYKAKKNKVVFFLSTIHKQHRILPAENPKKKPEVTIFYNGTKGGVDKADEMLRQYSCKAGSRRWPLACFYNLIDIACLNAYVISDAIGLSHGSRRDFLINLAQQLCEPLMVQRAASSKIPRLLGNIRRILPVVPPVADTNAEVRRTTCRLCKINKTRISCVCCKEWVCGSCSQPLCSGCLSKLPV